MSIGPLTTVDAGTLSPTRDIRRGAKLDAHVHVAGYNVDIGERTVIAAQCGFAGSVQIGADVLIGGQVGIADHVVVGEGARIAAKSGVIGDVPARSTVAGYPAVPRMALAAGPRKALQRHEGRPVKSCLRARDRSNPADPASPVALRSRRSRDRGGARAAHRRPQVRDDGRTVVPGTLPCAADRYAGRADRRSPRADRRHSRVCDGAVRFVELPHVFPRNRQGEVSPYGDAGRSTRPGGHRRPPSLQRVEVSRGEGSVDGTLCASAELLASVVDRKR